MYIRLRDHEPFAFAGLWEVWQDSAGVALRTCTILTTAANTLLHSIHHRMPALLDPAAETIWLDRRVVAPQTLLSLLQPFGPEKMEAYAVSPLVNSPHHDSPACIAPVEAMTQ